MYKNDSYYVYMQTRGLKKKKVLCLVARFLIYVHAAFVTRQCRFFVCFLTGGGGVNGTAVTVTHVT